MKLFKWVHRNGQTGVDSDGTPTHTPMTWGENKTNQIFHRAPTPMLCTNGVIHAYISVLHAIMFKNHHLSLDYPGKLWECEGDVEVDDGTKVGCFELTTKRMLDIDQWMDVDHPQWRDVASIVLRTGVKLRRRVLREQYAFADPHDMTKIEQWLDRWIETGKKTDFPSGLLNNPSIQDLTPTDRQLFHLLSGFQFVSPSRLFELGRIAVLTTANWFPAKAGRFEEVSNFVREESEAAGLGV